MGPLTFIYEMGPLTNIEEMGPLTFIYETGPLTNIEEMGPSNFNEETGPLTFIEEMFPTFYLLLRIVSNFILSKKNWPPILTFLSSSTEVV